MFILNWIKCKLNVVWLRKNAIVNCMQPSIMHMSHRRQLTELIWNFILGSFLGIDQLSNLMSIVCKIGERFYAMYCCACISVIKE